MVRWKLVFWASFHAKGQLLFHVKIRVCSWK